MNRAILVGNLANDPESRLTQSGITQCTFRLATQRRVANKDGTREADFHTIVCWRAIAENCARYLRKGSRVAIEGSIQNRSYDAQDGTKRYVTEIVADNVEFLSKKDEDRGGKYVGTYETPVGGTESKVCAGGGSVEQHVGLQQQYPASAARQQIGFEEVDDDELPF